MAILTLVQNIVDIIGAFDAHKACNPTWQDQAEGNQEEAEQILHEAFDLKMQDNNATLAEVQHTLERRLGAAMDK